MDPKKDIRVDVGELHAHLTRYIDAVRDGETVIVVSGNEVIAELRPPRPPSLPPRRPGRLEGKIWMAEDFETWPEGFLHEMEEWKF